MNSVLSIGTLDIPILLRLLSWYQNQLMLKKVVENTAGMTSTTQDGGTSLDHEEPMPTYEVRFDEREN